MPGSFLLIKGIKGKSKQESRTLHLDVCTWKLAAAIPVDIDSSKGSLTTGQGSATELTCDIICDTTVVVQFTSCLGGRHFEEAHLVVTKNVGKGPGPKKAVEFFYLDMEDVIISASGLGGRLRAEPRLIISIKFARYKMQYLLYDEKGTKLDQDSDGYDVGKHTGQA